MWGEVPFQVPAWIPTGTRIASGGQGLPAANRSGHSRPYLRRLQWRARLRWQAAARARASKEKLQTFFFVGDRVPDRMREADQRRHFPHMHTRRVQPAHDSRSRPVRQHTLMMRCRRGAQSTCSMTDDQRSRWADRNVEEDRIHSMRVAEACWMKDGDLDPVDHPSAEEPPWAKPEAAIQNTEPLACRGPGTRGRERKGLASHTTWFFALGNQKPKHAASMLRPHSCQLLAGLVGLLGRGRGLSALSTTSPE